jgi:Heterokaryon incompatibility protein (HET)
VVLHSGKSNEIVRCSLNVVDTDEFPEYEALSYVWGSQEDLRTILLENKEFSITNNLFVALQLLRRKDTDRYIWIDALSINQNDIEERNAQVQNMRNIYTEAQMVIACLGPALKQHDVFMDFFAVAK